jgi:hypothetical protein
MDSNPDWHVACVYTYVTIAAPIANGRISPLLDTAARLLVVTCRNGKEALRREVMLRPMSPDGLANCVAELQVEVLLCAALSEGLRRELERHGIQIRPHLRGNIEAVFEALCHGQLNQPEFRMPGCRGNHPEIICPPHPVRQQTT